VDSIAVRDEPLLSEEYEVASNFSPVSGAAYVYARSTEDRSGHVDSWIAAALNASFAQLVEDGVERCVARIGGGEQALSMRSKAALKSFINSLNASVVYLDITGLDYNVWAPLLRAAVAHCQDVRVVYVEPRDYKFVPTPTESDIFDLSEKVRGISPILGFAALDEPDRERVCFVPLLGFEGTRLAHVLEHVQPPGERIFPIVGVPGFRLEYPFHAYHGNKGALLSSRAWKNVRYAVANCPFSLFYALKGIKREHAQDRLVIAPIGTKPHGLGAVLYSIASQEPVELVYDHPIRKADRTSGMSRLLVYHVSRFLGQAN
jgi:hypothetical protein